MTFPKAKEAEGMAVRQWNLVPAVSELLEKAPEFSHRSKEITMVGGRQGGEDGTLPPHSIYPPF